MRRVIVSSSTLLALILVVISVTLVQPCKAAGVIYIRADGSIDPPTTPISTLDQVTYKLTGDITSSGDGIIVERDNIIIDGNGYTLQGSGSGNGISSSLGLSLHVTIENIKIRDFGNGITTRQDVFATVTKSNIMTCGNGISVGAMSSCDVFENIITACGFNLYLQGYTSCNICRNNINNALNYGIVAVSSANRVNITENNIINNNGGGFGMQESSFCNITKNRITNNAGNGIAIGAWSGDNTVSKNFITGNGGDGIRLSSLSGFPNITENTILNNIGAGVRTTTELLGGIPEVRCNIIVGNGYGVWMAAPAKILHNTFFHNTIQAFCYSAESISVWDDGYPAGGNYWADYVGQDHYKGPNQDIPGSDGIGDTPYVIDANNKDNYPLLYPNTLLPPQNAVAEPSPIIIVCSMIGAASAFWLAHRRKLV